MPTGKVGDTFHVKRLHMHEGRTVPPSPLTETELITDMDRNGIGTDATVAQHIATIQVSSSPPPPTSTPPHTRPRTRPSSCICTHTLHVPIFTHFIF